MPTGNLIRLVGFVIAIIAVVTLLFTDNRGVRIASSNNSGTTVPVGRTNAPTSAFGNEPTCQAGGCHEQPDLAPLPGETLSIEVRDSSGTQIVNSYQPGVLYNIRVNHTNTATGWGFQITAIDDTNRNPAGILSSPDSTTITRCGNLGALPCSPGIRYYTNHASNITGNWSFNWMAPPTDVGQVTFYASGVRIVGSLNGNPADDRLYLATTALPASQPGTVQFSSGTFNQSESGGTATITVTRTGSSGAASVQFSTAAGSATGGTSCSAGVDYLNTSGTLNWADADAGNKTFAITICPDNIFEGNETVNLALSNASGATLGAPSTATLTINDDDSQPTISINDVTQAEGNSGTTNFGFTVSLSNPTAQTVNVNYATADGTATVAGGDYQAIGSTLLTFNPGETTKAVTVLANGDTTTEANETFFVNLSGIVNATIADGQGIGTIVDDEVQSSTLQFSASNYAVTEGAGSVTLTVNRSGSSGSPAAVDFAISSNIGSVPCNNTSGAAAQNCDYIIAAGTLSFASGETSKTFTVLIVDDVYVEGNETLNVSLANPTGGVLGTPNSASVTITDNDSTQPTTNPLENADARFFVRQHYLDFLNREPDPAGLSYWSNEITRCGSDTTCIKNRRIGVSNAFFFEVEFQRTGAYVYRLYRAAFGNDQPLPNPETGTEARKLPAYAVFVRDRARVIESTDLAQSQLDLANAFVQRGEFLARYPAGLSGEQFVDALLARISTDSGADLGSQRSALINLFNQGGRGAVLYRLADDNLQTNPISNRLFIDAEYNRSFVYTQYAGYLRRDADIGGFLFWLNVVNQFPLRDGPGQNAMVCAFITSREYQERFSPIVTRFNSECAP